MRRTLLLAFVVLAARASFTFAGEAPSPAARMGDAAKAFLDTLVDAGKAKAVFEFEEAFKRFIALRARSTEAPADLKQRILGQLDISSAAHDE